MGKIFEQFNKVINSCDIASKNTQNISDKLTINLENQSYDNSDDVMYRNEQYELAEEKNALDYIKRMTKDIKKIVDQHPAKPKNYDEWTKREQYEYFFTDESLTTYIPGLPKSLLFFLRAALYRGDCGRSPTEKPLWLNMDKFRKGQKFAQEYISSIIFANMLSLFMIFPFTNGLKPMIFSRQSHTPYLAFKRYLSTGQRVINWLTKDPWTKGTKAYKDIQTVRKMHRAMRLKLCKHNSDEISEASKIPNAWCPDRDLILEDFSSCPYPALQNGYIHGLPGPKGLNQADMASTQFAFIGLIVLYPKEFGINVNDEDLDAFCHVWRSIGYLLGIQDEYNFCQGNLEQIRQRARDFIEVWVKASFRQVTPEWEHMLRSIVESNNYILMDGFTFKLLLLYIANILDIPMPRIQNSLTYLERLKLILRHFIFRYLMRIRFVRNCINKMLYRLIDRAAKFTSEKRDSLKEKSDKIIPDPFSIQRRKKMGKCISTYVSTNFI